MRRLLALLFLLDGLVVVGLVRPLRLASHYPGPTWPLFDIIGHNYGATLRFTALVAAMVALFLLAYRVANGLSGRRATLVVFGGAGLLALTFLLLYPATNHDLFHYVMEGRILWVHHNNPFTVAPVSFPNDPFYCDAFCRTHYGWYEVNREWQWAPSPNLVWEGYPSPYGPAWAVLTGLPLLLGHGDPIWTLISFKLLSVAFLFLGAVAVFHGVRFLRPGREWGATVLFAWNPLVLMYVAGNGANDMIMMGLTLVAVYLAMRQRWNSAFPVLALACLIKFVSAVLIPVFIVYAVITTPREKWRHLVESLALSAVIGLVMYAPFWRGKLTFETLRTQARQFTDSPPALLLRLLERVTTPTHAEFWTKSFALMLFAAAYAFILYRLIAGRRRHSADDLPSAAFAVMCAYLMLSVFWFQPWYLLWLISLGALTVGVRARLTLLFSFTGLLTHTATSIAAIKLWYWTDIHPNGMTYEVGLVVSMVFLPPGLYIACVLLARTEFVKSLRARRSAVAGRAGPTIGPRGGTPVAEA